MTENHDFRVKTWSFLQVLQPEALSTLSRQHVEARMRVRCGNQDGLVMSFALWCLLGCFPLCEQLQGSVLFMGPNGPKCPSLPCACFVW